MLKFRRRMQDTNHGPKTYVAPGTKILGTIQGKGSYVFCGTIEGDCDISGPLTLAEGGHWKGTIKATDIVIAGTVEGDIKVKSGPAPVTFQEKRGADVQAQMPTKIHAHS